MTSETNDRKDQCSDTTDNVGHSATQVPAASIQIEKEGLMRRKLIYGMIWGLALHTIMPRETIAGGEAPITEAMVLDFLKRLKEVVDHDDLGDRAFIEKTLRVKFSIARSGEQPIPDSPDVKRAWREFRLVSDIEPLLQLQDSHRSHKLLDQGPTAQLPAERDLRLVFDPNRFGAVGITEAYLFQVFGKPLSSGVTLAKKSNNPAEGFAHRSHGFRYDKKNSIVVTANVSGRSGFVTSIQVYENVLRLNGFGR